MDVGQGVSVPPRTDYPVRLTVPVQFGSPITAQVKVAASSLPAAADQFFTLRLSQIVLDDLVVAPQKISYTFATNNTPTPRDFDLRVTFTARRAAVPPSDFHIDHLPPGFEVTGVAPPVASPVGGGLYRHDCVIRVRVRPTTDGPASTQPAVAYVSVGGSANASSFRSFQVPLVVSAGPSDGVEYPKVVNGGVASAGGILDRRVCLRSRDGQAFRLLAVKADPALQVSADMQRVDTVHWVDVRYTPPVGRGSATVVLTTTHPIDPKLSLQIDGIGSQH